MPVVAPPTWAGDADRFRTLYHLLAALSRAGDLDDVYRSALDTLVQVASADRAAILLFDDDGVIRFKASRGLSCDYQAAATGHCPWPLGTLDAQPLVVPDVLLDAGLAPFHGVFAREGIRALMFVPLALEAGVFGKFMLYYSEPREWAVDEIEITQVIAAHVALATERKRAELARTQSEQRLQAILDNSSAVISLKDPQGRYQLVNRRYEEVFHFSKAEVIGLTDHDIFPAAIAERFQANDRQVLASGKPLSIEEHAPHDDGLHTYLSLKFPLLGSGGDVTAIGAIATDITERKQYEDAGRRLAAIVESSNDAIISKNLNGIINSWNKGAERIFGYTAAEIVGKPVSTLAAPERLDEMPIILSKIRQGHRVEHYETRRRRKDGTIIDVALTVSPVRDAAGRIVGASKIARDITDRKQAEQERASLLAREQEARRTAEILNRIGPRLVAQLDPQKLAQEVTDIATSLVGAEFGTFFLNVINEEGVSYVLYTVSGPAPGQSAGLPIPPVAELFARTFRGEAIVRCDDITLDPRYSKDPPSLDLPEGHPPVRSYLAVPVVARSGEVLGGLFFGHSVPGKFTEMHETMIAGVAAQAAIAMDNARLFEQAQWVQAELKRSNEELRRANRDLEVFAYSASHDLQEPLRTIAISAQLFQKRLERRLQADDREFLATILTAARRMKVLIEDLLAYAQATKYEEGAVPRVDSGRVLADVLAALRGPIEEAKARITTGHLPAVSIHESRLAQLFQNLVSNALKYRGKEVPRVHVAAAERDGWWVFSVVDNGIGIEPQYADRIFGLFKRLHGRDEYPGSGIGLAICQRVVEQYGGRIWLERSTPGKGSTFCFALPSRAGSEPVGEPPGL